LESKHLFVWILELYNIIFILKCDSIYYRLYIAGAEPQLKNLYGKVEYPVVRGTPMISPMLKWDHSNDYVVPNFVEKVI